MTRTGVHLSANLITTSRWRLLLAMLVLAATSLSLTVVGTPEARGASTLPAGFEETVVFSGLTNPTVVRFAADGRVFVAEKRGVIKVFDSLTDPTPDVFADLNVNVHNFWDRGLLGMALDPNFPADALRLRPLRVRPRAGIHGCRAAVGHAGGVLRSLSDPSRCHGGRVRGQRTTVAAAGERQHHDGRGAGAGRGLVPAVPEPLGGHRGVRPGRPALRERR